MICLKSHLLILAAIVTMDSVMNPKKPDPLLIAGSQLLAASIKRTQSQVDFMRTNRKPSHRSNDSDRSLHTYNYFCAELTILNTLKGVGQ